VRISFGLLAGLALAAGSRASQKPAVHVPETRPFTVRGVHFRPHERVEIVVQARGRGEAHATAGADGSFSAVVGDVELDGCVGYAVKAEGDKGSRAARKLRPAECGTPLQDD
jgi:hypothetical protein